MSIILETEGLSKRYGRHVALDHCSLKIHRGDIYGFIGNNGAGKTTLMKIIMGLSRPSGGTYALFGIAASEVDCATRRRVAAIIETPAFYPNMTGRENLELHMLALGRPSSKDRVTSAMNAARLSDQRGKKVRGYSLGMRQRLGIARTILSEAELVILDEPSNGLDPSGILELRECILALNREKGVTFLVATHHTLELDGLATRFGIIKSGRIVEELDDKSLKANMALEGKDIERYFIDRMR